MLLDDPWSELYKNWPARNEREVKALKLLAEGEFVKARDDTGMSREEFRDFLEWARNYEIEHLCVKVERK